MTTFSLSVRYNRNYPADSPTGSIFNEVNLSSSDTALLLVDVYHASEKPEAKHLVNTQWDQKWWDIINSNLPPVIELARLADLPIIYVMNSSPHIEINHSAFGIRLNESMGFDPEVHFREIGVDPREYCSGDPVQLVVPPQIAPRAGDYYIRKHTYSGFFETRLDSLLRNLGIRNLIVAGFVADCCILFTVADAVFRGYYPVLLRDCTLAVETPNEVGILANTDRTIIWIETFLGPSVQSRDFISAIQETSLP